MKSIELRSVHHSLFTIHRLTSHVSRLTLYHLHLAVRCSHILLLSAFLIPSLLTAGVTLSGYNKAEFIYLDAPDSLSNHFHNELNLKLNYRKTEFGLTFSADLPRYSHLANEKELSPDKIEYEWHRYYLTTRLDNLTLTLGTFNEFFGRGIVLRSFEDKDLEWDTTLSGFSTHFHTNSFYIKAIYAALAAEDNNGLYDTAAGFDIHSAHVPNLNIGFSFLSMQELNIDKYRTRLIGGSRFEYFADMFDISAEYAYLKLYRNIANTISGSALYAYANTYIRDFTISKGYKKYRYFNSRLSDLPNLNSSDIPLSGRAPGSDEEGVLGQISYQPDRSTVISLAYSEAWNSNDDIKQSDLYIEGSKHYDNFYIGLEYGQLETVDEPLNQWKKEITSAAALDFYMLGIKSGTRLQYKVETETNKGLDRVSHYPFMQYELFLDKYTLSLFAEAKIADSKKPLWMGIQLLTDLSDHSEIKLFVGNERGGKICRSGQCLTTVPFKGVRLEIGTRF